MSDGRSGRAPRTGQPANSIPPPAPEAPEAPEGSEGSEASMRVDGHAITGTPLLEFRLSRGGRRDGNTFFLSVFPFSILATKAERSLNLL